MENLYLKFIVYHLLCLIMLESCVVAYDVNDYPFNSSRINRPSYQRKLRARGSGPTMPSTGWVMCCEPEFEVVPNMEHSYVWPMETPERNYFVVSGINYFYFFHNYYYFFFNYFIF